MPNTKSAERRVRSNARKQAHNRSISSRLKTLEKRYNAAVKSGKRDEAITVLKDTLSAFDKAAKVGVIHRAKANRKKSRLTVRMAALK
ncbi:MAG TPA: 30S ribosomal protein S20 [Candidatus Acidoferrum sp.]|nr:30S ribosomal protein S20 [Candidatus Acidoferrum sp.]